MICLRRRRRQNPLNPIRTDRRMSELEQKREETDSPKGTQDSQLKNESLNHELSNAREIALSDSKISMGNVELSESYILYLAEESQVPESSSMGQVEDNRPFYTSRL